MAAANPARGQLGFEVGGRSYTLAFTTNAICAIEDTFALESIEELPEFLKGNHSVRVLRKLFRLALTDSDPDMDDQAAGPLIDAIGGLEPASKLLLMALQAAFPEAAREGATNPPRVHGGTGQPSKRAGARSGAIPNNSGG